MKKPGLHQTLFAVVVAGAKKAYSPVEYTIQKEKK